MRYYVYKFLDRNRNVIYVGQTTNTKNRIEKQHFTEHGHLSKECYAQVYGIYYAELNSKTDMDLYERYLISKNIPKYNIIHNKGDVTLNLEELDWCKYDRYNCKIGCSCEASHMGRYHKLDQECAFNDMNCAKCKNYKGDVIGLMWRPEVKAIAEDKAWHRGFPNIEDYLMDLVLADCELKQKEMGIK